VPTTRKSRKVWLFFILLIGGGSTAYYYRSRPRPISKDSVRRPVLAALVFKNENDNPDLDFLTKALAHDTIAKIGQLCSSGFDVIGYDSVLSYHTSRKTLHQIGSELGVDYILQGGVWKNRDKVRVSAQLIRVSDQVQLWTVVADRKLGEASEVQSDIIERIAASLGVSIRPADIVALNEVATTNSTARETYLKAVDECEGGTRPDMKACIASLGKALEADPDYVRAHLELALAQMQLTKNYDVAEKHVRIALRKTDAIPQAHILLAEILYKRYGNDDGADEEFRKGIALNRSESDTYLSYAEFLLEKNRLDEAQAQITRGLTLDPFRISMNLMAGRILTAAKSYDRAIERLGNTVAMDRTSPEIRYYLGQAYLARSMYDDAIREFEKAVSFGPGVPEYAAALEQARAARTRRHG